MGPVMKNFLSQENILNISPRAEGTKKLFNMICFHLWRMDERGLDRKQADELGGFSGDQPNI